MEFRPLASSSAGNSYVVSSAGQPSLLLDAGLSFKELQRATCFNLGSFAGVLLTHAHGDHSKAVKELLNHGVNIYSSAECWEEIWPDPHEYKNRSHRAKVVTPKHSFTVSDWRITPFEAVHDSPGTLGFVVDEPLHSPLSTHHCGADRLLYLTDTAYSKFTFEGLTHICIECNHSMAIIKDRALAGDLTTDRFRRTAHNHMSLERLIPMLKANDLSRCREIWLLHMSSANSDEAQFINEVQRAVGVPVYAAAE